MTPTETATILRQFNEWRLCLAEKGHEDPKDANVALLVTYTARSEQLARVLREVIEAIEFTPLGVRTIKALEAARVALEWRTPKTEGIAE